MEGCYATAPGDYPKKVSDPEPGADGEEMGACRRRGMGDDAGAVTEIVKCVHNL